MFVVECYIMFVINNNTIFFLLSVLTHRRINRSIDYNKLDQSILINRCNARIGIRVMSNTGINKIKVVGH